MWHREHPRWRGHYLRVEDGTFAIIGVAKPNDTVDTIYRAARMVKPAVVLGDDAVRIWSLNQCNVVTVEIPANDGRLYQYNGACLVRRGTQTVPLSVEEISAYLNAHMATRWELGVCAGTTLYNIDTEAIERYLAYLHLRRFTGTADLLLGLQAAACDAKNAEIRPNNAGILMFGFDPQLPIPQSEVVCITFDDTLGVHSYLDRKNLLDTLPALVDQTSSFLKQYIRVGATIRGFRREDEPEYPYEALREARVNAIVHRDYSRVGETVRVFIYPDRVEVRSPYGLPPGLSLDDHIAMRVTSKPRNSILAGFLRDIPGYMERIGSGIRFMITEMRAMGLPDPEFTAPRLRRDLP